MNVRHFLFTGVAAMIAAAAVLALRANGQAPPNAAQPAGTTVVVEARDDGTLVERTLDGKILRTYQGRVAPGKGPAFVPYTTADGRTAYQWSTNAAAQPYAQDAESQKLVTQEQAAAQEARALSAQAQQAGSDEAKADAKKKLREKLAEIFDLQQQRRTREIANIEERLAKLKDTLKKRESAKDSIVDRRVETLTGGVDELGWEESFPTQSSPSGYGPPGYGPATIPVPPSVVPRFAPPATSSEPVPVAPAAGAPAAFPGASPAPPVLPVPAAPPAPAAPTPPTAPRR